MELSAKQFLEVLGNSAKGQQLKGEKRGATRIPLGRRSAILRESGQMAVVIRELSITGTSLMVSRAIPVGERLIVCIPRLVGPDLKVKCVVMRCESGSGGKVFVVGLKFVELLKTEETVQAATATLAGETSDVIRIRQAMLGM